MDNWTREQWEEKRSHFPDAAFYLYTPLCGTCAVASKMMEVIAELKPDLPLGKADLNYVESIAIDFEIESVPCLLIQRDGELAHKIYAFQSVPYLLEKLS
ncbi:thiol reductase thioredoxin [Sporosarcina sp. NCCP-2222]|uniref:thioredoxin family protein n=1 Tax=Sporosarcina sp. NCCP-2222 TaxID=2935073 RepID=UPI002088D502|nr:thioredoxin family protein [Sporosarcina sp. NCCP-2222]GKV56963.1 thiol reductase thioredoxin [Sporosarcina sp. NCCP-2222]